MTGTISQDVTAVNPPQPPVAAFTYTVNFLVVSVDASGSSDPDGTISSYAWTWGDGTIGTGMTATHTYATAGTKTITLVVTDNSGMTGTVSHDVEATLPPGPTASFTYVVSGMSVSVDASASTGTDLTYAWSWGDGTTGSGVTATHTYTAPTAMGNSVSGKAPPVPHPFYGFTWAEDGVTPITDCVLTFTDVNTGKSFTYTQEAGANAYVVDASMFGEAGSYANGDTVHITATAPGYYGEADYIINTANDMDGPWDVILHPSGPAPFDVTITLTVTDMYGRTATISQTVTITP
jgi:chitodextrinase